MRHTIRWLCVFLLGVAAGLALARLKPDRPPAPRLVERAAGFVGPVVTVPPDVASEVAEQLDRLLEPVRYDGLPLEDVVENFRDTTRVQIYVNWNALQAAGLRRNTPVTLALPAQSFRDRLDRVLRAVGGDRVLLGADVEEGVVSVSTGEDLSKNVLTRVYDVRHLIRPDQRAADVAAAVRLVQGVDPWSWKSFGGNSGAIRELSGQLVVTQTPSAHVRIEAVLAETPAMTPAPPVPPQTLRPRTFWSPAPPDRQLNAAYVSPATRPAPEEPPHNAPQF